MKPNLTSFLTLALGAALVSPLAAQEEDSAPEPQSSKDWSFELTTEQGKIVVRSEDGKITTTLDGEPVDSGRWTFLPTIVQKPYDATDFLPTKRIGISFESVGGALASHLDVETGDALLITAVEEDAPAARAGIQVHDVIVSIDGASPVTGEILREAVQAAGDSVRLGIVRAGQRMTVQVEIEVDTLLPQEITYENLLRDGVWTDLDLQKAQIELPGYRVIPPLRVTDWKQLQLEAFEGYEELLENQLFDLKKNQMLDFSGHLPSINLDPGKNLLYTQPPGGDPEELDTPFLVPDADSSFGDRLQAIEERLGRIEELLIGLGKDAK